MHQKGVICMKEHPIKNKVAAGSQKKSLKATLKTTLFSRKPKQNREEYSETIETKEKNSSADTASDIGYTEQTLYTYNTISAFYRQSMVYLRRQAQAEGLGGMNPFLLLLILRNEGINQDELARRIRFDKGAMARTIRHLVERGYVSRVRDPDDGRRYNLYTTDKCKALLPALDRITKRYQDVLHGNMTPEQIHVMRSLMEKASENLTKSNRQEAAPAKMDDDEY